MLVAVSTLEAGLAAGAATIGFGGAAGFAGAEYLAGVAALMTGLVLSAGRSTGCLEVSEVDAATFAVLAC
ncbi:MAG: hypothetical protein ACREUC_23175, partial [Steroidobacteraceae bacterium]